MNEEKEKKKNDEEEEDIAFSDGDKVVRGQRGVVMGPVMLGPLKGKGLAIKFPGDREDMNVALTDLSRESVRLRRGEGWGTRGTRGACVREGWRRARRGGEGRCGVRAGLVGRVVPDAARMQRAHMQGVCRFQTRTGGVG